MGYIVAFTHPFTVSFALYHRHARPELGPPEITGAPVCSPYYTEFMV